MFYYLEGKLAHHESSLCVIDCGGVGYQLTVSLTTSDRLYGKEGQTVKLYTHLAVREDGVELYGFGSNEERVSFHRLTSVSGVGPKVAMSILSVLPPDRLALAICTDDIKGIAKAPGVGQKTAARIVLELRDKVSKEMLSGDAAPKGARIHTQQIPENSALAEATEALMVLGYDKNTILNALTGLDTSKLEVGEIVRQALKKLAR